jgi:hypothetical protein
MECSQLRSVLAAALHAELDPATTRSFEDHVAGCVDCARLLAFERVFETSLRSQPPVQAPAALQARVRAAVGRPAQGLRVLRSFGRPLLWAASGALAAALLLLVARPPHPSVSGPVSAEVVGTIVCLGCTLRPESVPLHVQDRGRDHLNGLQDRDGRLWHILDTAQHHSLLVDDALLGRNARLQGTAYPASQSILLQSLQFTESDSAALRGLWHTAIVHVGALRRSASAGDGARSRRS